MSDKLPKWLTDEQREFVNKCLEAGWEIFCIVEAEFGPKSSVVKHHVVFLTDDELHKIYPVPIRKKIQEGAKERNKTNEI